jgi:hypothetical protein
VVALIGLVGTLLVGYWQFGPKLQGPESTKTAYVGRVIDNDSRQPVVGAKVTLDLEGVPPIVFTDSEGVYRFEVTIDSEISGQVRVDAQGYQTYTRLIKLVPEQNTIEDIRLIPLPPTSTPEVPVPATFTPEATSTFTPTASPSPTGTPLVVKTIPDGCVFSKTWKTYALDPNVSNSVRTEADNCYDMGITGIFADRGGVLHLLERDKRILHASGIYTPVANSAVIEFKVFVKSMYLAPTGEPTYVSFAIAPADDPTASKKSARFKLQMEEDAGKRLIYFVLADVDENNGARLTGQHYEYQRTYTLRFELTGSIMSIFINNIKLNENLSIPGGEKVFYLGFNVPAYTGVDVEVTDIKIDGSPK